MLARAFPLATRASQWCGPTCPHLPFDDGSLALVFSSHLHGHFVGADERAFFRSECARVAPVLVLVEQAPQPGRTGVVWRERRLSDGTPHSVFKRYLRAAQLAAEVGGSVLLENASFVAAAVGRRADTLTLVRLRVPSRGVRPADVVSAQLCGLHVFQLVDHAVDAGPAGQLDNVRGCLLTLR